MVDLPESSEQEIRRPFTQQELLERTAALLERKEALRVLSTGTGSGRVAPFRGGSGFASGPGIANRLSVSS